MTSQYLRVWDIDEEVINDPKFIMTKRRDNEKIDTGFVINGCKVGEVMLA